MTDVSEASEVSPPPPQPPTPALLDRLGARAERRMTPRIGVTLAGAGGFIAVFGAIGIGGDQLVTDDGDIQRIPGVLISLALIAAGFAVLRSLRTAPLSTAASIGIAVGIPMLLVFTTVDDGDFPPFSFDAVLLLSTLAWAAAYAVGPARGRTVLLTLALVFAPVFVMEQVEEISEVPESIGAAFTQAFVGAAEEGFAEEGFGDDFTGEDFAEEDFQNDFTGDDFGFGEPEFPDPTNLGVIALAFGLGYLLASLLASRRGYLGTGTPLAAVGAVVTALGVALLADDLGDVGSGIALVVLGAGVLAVGAVAARRFTSWFGGLLVGIGVLVLVGEALGEDASTMTTSIVFLFVGLAVVCVAHLLGAALGEPAEEDERRSFRPGTRRRPGTSPALDDAQV